MLLSVLQQLGKEYGGQLGAYDSRGNITLVLQTGTCGAV